MKKFLSILSLVIAILMIAVPVASAEDVLLAAPAEDGAVAEDVAAWVAPAGITTYYATDVSGNAPLLDGTISEGEYGPAIRITDPKACSAGDWGASWSKEGETINEDVRSEYMDVYFAYDEQNIYVAIYDMSQAVNNTDDNEYNDYPFRSNYTFYFGFDLNDLQNYFQFGGYQTHIQWANLNYFEFGKKNEAPIKTYDLISEAVIRKADLDKNEDIGFGDLLSANGNPNYYAGLSGVTMEFKLDRSVVAQAMNECFFTDYDTTSNAMYFGINTLTYVAEASDYSGRTQYWQWMGNNDIREKQADYSDFGIYEGSSREKIFDLVVFGDENTPIEIADPFPIRPETEAPTTEAPTTEAPTTEVVADVTEAPTTEAPVAAEGGCGSSVALAGVALVVALGTCTAFVAKKKED